jgi:hypothetical protein
MTLLRLRVSLEIAQRRSNNKWVAIVRCDNGMAANSPDFDTPERAREEGARMIEEMKYQLPRDLAPLGYTVTIQHVGKA